MNIRHGKQLLLAVVLAFGVESMRAQSLEAPAILTSAQVVERMQQHNQAQSGELKQYQALRHYEVEYRGFSAKVAAKMDVEVKYDAATGKSFHIVAESGSGFLCKKVLERAVESEKEAARDTASTALTEKNYRFRLAGTDTVAGRPAYILEVEPITESKFLYRGRIWVDAAEFAVVKMETEPARSPSFWITRTQIHYMSAESNGFWLPGNVRSETSVRMGGTAVLTINYGSYAVQSEDASHPASFAGANFPTAARLTPSNPGQAGSRAPKVMNSLTSDLQQLPAAVFQTQPTE